MANDDSLMSQDEIERLFSQTKDPAAPAKAPPAARPAGGKDDQPLAQDDIEKLLNTPAAAVAAPPAPAAHQPTKTAAAAQQSREPDIATQDIEYLLRKRRRPWNR